MLDRQFKNIMEFPEVEEYLEKEKEESRLNMSLRASSNALANFTLKSVEVVKLPTREIVRDSISIVAGSIIKANHFDQRGECGDKSIDRKSNADRKSSEFKPNHARYHSDLPVCKTCGCNQPIHQA